MKIYLTDKKGDEWVLEPINQWKANKHGLVTSWWAVVFGPYEVAKYYPQIPIPCFTEWWT